MGGAGAIMMALWVKSSSARVETKKVNKGKSMVAQTKAVHDKESYWAVEVGF